jgi:hypothetical protein
MGVRKIGISTIMIKTTIYNSSTKVAVSPEHLQSRNIVLDTCFFVQKLFDFNNPEIENLEKFGHSEAINIYLVDITVREIEKKIEDIIEDIDSRLGGSALRTLSSFPLYKRFRSIYTKEKMVSYLREQLYTFISKSKAKIIKSENISPAKVFNRYFSEAAPFESSKGKNRKSEFPDAFMLEAITEFFLEKKERAYIVTNDSDWMTFCNTTYIDIFDDRLAFIIVNSPSKVTELILRNDKELTNLAKFADSIFSKEEPTIIEAFLGDKRKYSFCDSTDRYSKLHVGIVNADIVQNELISVSTEEAIYKLAIELDVVSRKVSIDRNDSFGTQYTDDSEQLVSRSKVIFEAFSAFQYSDGIAGKTEISLEFPVAIEVNHDSGQHIKWSEWIETLPVLVCGVEKGHLTKNGHGCQRFSSIAEAQKVFPDLSLTGSSSVFTGVMGDRLADELRFDTWRTYEFMST